MVAILFLVLSLLLVGGTAESALIAPGQAGLVVAETVDMVLPVGRGQPTKDSLGVTVKVILVAFAVVAAVVPAKLGVVARLEERVGMA